MKNLYEMEELNVNEKAILTLLDDSLDRIINEHNETIALSEIKHLSGSINYLIGSLFKNNRKMCGYIERNFKHNQSIKKDA